MFRYRLLLLAAAVLFSTGGVAIKGNALTAWQVASFRSVIAALFLALVAPAGLRGWSWRLLPVSLSYAATLVLFVQATRLTTAANAIFLQSTAPGYMILIGPLLLKEPIRRSDLWLLAGVGAGLLLFLAGVEPATATAPEPAAGNALALLAGLTWAFTIAGLRWLARKEGGSDPGPASVVLGNLLAASFALPGALPATAFNLQDGLVILYLGTCQVGLAYLCLTRAVAHIPAFEASVLLLLEPVLNPFWAWLFLAERPATPAIAGGAIILSSTLWNAWRQRGIG